MEAVDETTKQIAFLNDICRQYMGLGAIVVLTQAVDAMPADDQVEIQRLVRQYNDFNEGNDPYGEHDFGAFSYKGNRFNWKIDYYDLKLENGSENPADPSQTKRVLTIMLASDY